jgi:hypothetical protein
MDCDQASFGKGSLFIPSAQPKAALVAALFEPQAPDALVRWGFSIMLSRKKNIWKRTSRKMLHEHWLLTLNSNPSLKKLKDDAEFAKSPQARLEFFARRHSSWDQQYQQYPDLSEQIPFLNKMNEEHSSFISNPISGKISKQQKSQR